MSAASPSEDQKEHPDPCAASHVASRPANQWAAKCSSKTPHSPHLRPSCAQDGIASIARQLLRHPGRWPCHACAYSGLLAIDSAPMRPRLHDKLTKLRPCGPEQGSATILARSSHPNLNSNSNARRTANHIPVLLHLCLVKHHRQRHDSGSCHQMFPALAIHVSL
jgi:hypothetical protein